MPFGPGKYDDACTIARQITGARGAILVIVGGNKGEGFSAQLTGDDLQKIPSVLRIIANEIEKNSKEIN